MQAELRLTFASAMTGRYEIFLHFTRAPDYAFVRASFDGAPWTAFNGYAAMVTRDRALVGMRGLTPGGHEVLLKIVTKDEGTSFRVTMAGSGGASFDVRYCEVTAFK
jgi:hypothetical protein